MVTYGVCTFLVCCINLFKLVRFCCFAFSSLIVFYVASDYRLGYGRATVNYSPTWITFSGKLLRKSTAPHIRYSRNYLLQCNNSRWGEWTKGDIPAEIVRQNNLSEGLQRRKRYRGRKGCVQQRLRRNKTKIRLPTILLSNVQSRKGKIDTHGIYMNTARPV